MENISEALYKDIRPYTIEKIVNIYNEKDAIPAIQRGLVWNTVRVEVLWDSLMRGIPIGTLSIRNKGGIYEILDGQQRACAMNMAFTDLPNATSSDEEKTNSLLWIDLGMYSATTENEQGNTTISERKFIFRVTTAAHPWGYELSDNETKTSVLDFPTQRKIVSELENKWEKSDNKGARPYPYELWPTHKSKLPVPFSVVYKFVTDGNSSYDDFLKYLLNYKDTNWYQHFKNEFYNSMPSESRWKEICDGIDTASKMIIFATDASNVKPEDFVTYFRRMNKSGVVPSDEDIMYSMIKANVNDLKRLDNYSGGLTSPARLAYIVLRYSLSSFEDNKWIEKVTIEDVKKFNKEQYTRITEVVNKINEIKKKINDNTGELLPYHRVRFANFSNGDIYLLLMKLVEKDVSEVNLSGLATLILWFSINPSQTVKTIWEATVKSEKHFNVKCISEGVWKAASQGFLLPPPKLNDFKEIKNMAENLPKQYDCCFDACSDLVNFIESAERFPQLDKVWNGFYGKDGGRDLLLFACKEYIKDVFGGYDLSKPEWKEQNRPWDYDHILPKSWYHGTKYWGITNEKPFYALCDKMLWSIGNSCPLPFSQNRSNSNDGPEENYPNTTGDKDSENVHVNKEVLSKYKLLKNKYIDEKDGENYDVALNFIIGTAKRMNKLYSKWFDKCGIGELLQDASSCLQEKKPSLLLHIRKSLKENYPKCEIKCVYVARDNRQYEIDVNEPIDWAKGLYGWQSCGIECTLKESNEKCFLAVTTDGNYIEVGVRRHPKLTQILGTNDWYWPDRQIKSFRFDDKEHEDKSVEEIAVECLKSFEGCLEYINL